MKKGANPAWMEWLLRLMRLVCGGIFIYASIHKILHPAAFVQVLVNWKILPRAAVNFVALALPWVEMVGGIFLIIGIFEWVSLTLYNGLMAVFMIGIASVLIRGLKTTCGCFEVDAEEMTWCTFLRDLTMLIPGLVAYWILFQLRRPPIFKQKHP